MKTRLIETLGMDVTVGTPADLRNYAESEYNKTMQSVKLIKP
ncbi:MAG TPA: hypothetical protein VEA40_07315 [Ramlibacter sp.]|nr:hypothetical protein [Ramlibacter sp.]